jgi:hypothetical protein
MKRTVSLIVPLLVFASILALSLVVKAQDEEPAAKGSPDATFNATLGFAMAGTASGGARVESGQIKTDGKGNFKGSETRSDDGSISTNVPVTGTYSINSSGTGTITFNPKGFSAENYSITVVNHTQAGDALYLETDSGTVVTGSSVGSGTGCSNSSVSGGYGLVLAGTADSVGAVAVAGQFTADGKGNLSGSASGSDNGTIYTDVPISGTYSVKSGCTGTFAISVDSYQANFSMTIVNSRKEILLIETDSTTVVAGQATKQ